MLTSRKAITISMPPEMSEQVQQVLQENGRTMSEFVSEANRYTWRSGSGCGVNAANGLRPAKT